MKTFVRLFLSSAIFGIAIATAYWFIAHEEATGTALLGIMATALVFAASYALVAERDADLAGDRGSMQPADDSGEDLGVFTTESAWPILTAISITGALAGIVWSPVIAIVSGAAFALCLWRLGAESARVPEE